MFGKIWNSFSTRTNQHPIPPFKRTPITVADGLENCISGNIAMPLKKFMIFSALAALLAPCQMASAQINVPSAEFEHRGIESVENTRPFAGPGVFDYDTRAFAPLEFTNDEEKDPNTGFFLTYDRVYTSVSRPGIIGDGENGESVASGNNYIWGTRIEGGWMTEEDHGWSLGYQNSEGIFFTSGQDVTVANPQLVTNRFATVELNRIFRQQMKSGGYFEPYIGVQYINVNDETLQDTVETVGGVATPNRFKQEASNNAFGAHAGARFNRRRGRWRTTTDGAITAAYNQQRYFATDLINTPGAFGVTETYFEEQSFVPMLDLQFELAYNISRDITLRTGVQAMWIFDGIARANTQPTGLNPNSFFGTGTGAGLSEDSFIAAGFLFGFEWRR
jgi:hypothetical protein